MGMGIVKGVLESLFTTDVDAMVTCHAKFAVD
jgi:hypothetical protein